MSEPKFTPGNWTIEDVKIRGEGWAIASDHDFPTSTGATYRKYVAQFVSAEDAHLIAAAPDLYAAMEALVNADALSKVEVLVAGWNGPPEKPFAPHPPQLGARIETTCGRVYKLDKAMKDARAALAKARGEAP